MTRARVVRSGLLALSVTLLAGCGAASTALIPLIPTCTILGVQFLDNPQNDTAVWSEATDSNPPHFTFFRSLETDVYGVSEASMQTPSGTVLVRAQAHDAGRFADFAGGGWSMRARNVAAGGAFSPVFASGRANRANEQDDPAAAAAALPQLMTVGSANEQMFACAGGRSNDDAVRTTNLLEVKPPTGSSAAPGSTAFIQDLLNGDDRFVRNRPGPLIGPANPPTPTITNRPGNPVREGSVRCAMTQLGDDVATRELHMLAISNGVLYHSVATDFSRATDGGGFTFERFNTVSPWGDVAQALGHNFGTIVAAAIVARPTAVSVFFVAQSGGRYRLYHTVRFSNGSWRPADDVLALNGATLTGTNFPFKVAAGFCPVYGQPSQQELNYLIWDGDKSVHVGRVVTTPQQWEPGVQGIYPPLTDISALVGGSTDVARNPTLQLAITTRPAP